MLPPGSLLSCLKGYLFNEWLVFGSYIQMTTNRKKGTISDATGLA